MTMASRKGDVVELPRKPSPRVSPGRVAPADLDAEAAVLSSALLTSDALERAQQIVAPEHFYSDANRRIYEAALALRAADRPVDVVSVAGWLRDHGRLQQVGGSPYLGQLCDATPAVAHVESHAHVVVEKWRLRQLIATCQTVAAEGYGAADAEALITEAQARIGELTPKQSRLLHRLDTAGIFATLEPIPWLLAGLDLCPGAPAMVAGYGYSGKTVAAQDLALAVASGQRAWNAFAVRRGTVLHVDFEQGSRLTRERYQRLAAARMLTPDELRALSLISMPPLYLDSEGAAEFWTRECEGAALVIIDSLRAAAPSLEENDSGVRRTLDMLGRISETTGATVLVLHHARKPSQDKTGGARMAIRGSGALYDASSSVLVFEAEKGEPTRVYHEKARVTGRTADDFELTIADVEIDGNPRGGLSVSAESIGRTREACRSVRQLEAVRALIVAHLREHGEAAGRKALRERLGGTREVVYAALDELVAERIVEESGSYHRRTLRLAEKGIGPNGS